MPRVDFYVNHKLYVRVRLGQDKIVIGRAGDCDIQLPDERVSRLHAVIRPDDEGTYWIEDASSNGTRLNFSMVEEPHRLVPRDRIYIQDFVLIYQADETPSEDLELERTTLRWGDEPQSEQFVH